MGAPFEGHQDPTRAVTSYMDGRFLRVLMLAK
jgi:hypothetical protein